MEEQKILQEILQTVKATADRVDAQERRMEAIQEDIVSIKQELEDLDIRQRAISSTLENVTNRNISILAENHIDLNKKLYQILETENDVVLYKITTNQHSDILGNLEQRVATLESRISA